MPRQRYDIKFDEAICSYFESFPTPSWDTLLADIDAIIPESSPLKRRYQGVLDAVQLLELGWYAHVSALSRVKNERELRFLLLLLLGYIPAETERIGVPFFKRGGAGLDRLNFKTAIKLAPLLETFATTLLEQGTIQPAPETEASWFHYDSVRKLTSSDFDEMAARGGPKYRFGKYHVRGIPGPIGLVFVQLPDFAEVSFTVDKPTPVSKSDWPKYLLKVGEALGISGPHLYTVASPFLCQSPIRIHRMTWPYSSDPRTRFRIYTRVKSARTEMVELYQGSQPVTIRSPGKFWRQSVETLHSYLWKPVSDVIDAGHPE